MELLLNSSPKKYLWYEFKQEPMCNYTINYTLTSVDVTQGDPPFNELNEGEHETNIATFNNLTREIEFEAKKSSLLDKKFKFYFNVIVIVDKSVQP